MQKAGKWFFMLFGLKTKESQLLKSVNVLLYNTASILPFGGSVQS